MPVARSRAAGISRAASLHEKARPRARASGCVDVRVLELLDVLAHRASAAIAASILAGDEVNAVEHEEAHAEVAAGHAAEHPCMGIDTHEAAELQPF